jgi:hypothetical protein
MNENHNLQPIQLVRTTANLSLMFSMICVSDLSVSFTLVPCRKKARFILYGVLVTSEKVSLAKKRNEIASRPYTSTATICRFNEIVS